MARARAVPGLVPEGSYARAAASIVSVRSEEVWADVERVLDVHDIEGVHTMRVATRRLRAVLEIFGPCFPKDAYRRVLGDVKALADALGERRDRDVQIARLEAMVQATGKAERAGLERLLGALRAEQAVANVALEQALTQAERCELRGRLAALAAAAEGHTERRSPRKGDHA